ncbi:MAG: ComF family protein [Tannerellaceae bacterium]|jgi:ComF family protein|nr:ComF family protein [Tannerellaceae bacterium]
MKIPALEIMIRIFNDLLTLFFPRACLVCLMPLEETEQNVCLECFYNLPRLSRYASDSLQQRLAIAKAHEIKTAALFRYMPDTNMQNIVYPFKYHGNYKLAYQMGRQIAISVHAHEDFKTADYLVPVPIHPKRKRKRGYNQSEHLCLGISSVWKIPVRPDALKRNVHTKSQTKKLRDEREQNVKGVFDLDNIDDLKGCHIILVDDVLTTGSTISSCAQCLFNIPDVKISILTLAATTQSGKMNN